MNLDEITKESNVPALGILEKGTEMILRNQYGEYMVSKPIDDLPIDVLFSEVIIPVLLAAGYGEETIRGIVDVVY
ncbi:MAG: hypothetical protein U9O96_00020 [Candidatus Thermoplasmatota archaeon]|nr:hypothetical protein [Candidatus Thermoplasmatota archaeon]